MVVRVINAGVQNVPMLKSATAETAAACPKCGSDMVLAVVTPLPVASQLGKHTYLCAKCNQTTTYILPKDPEAEFGNASQTDTKSPVANGAGTPGDARTQPARSIRRTEAFYCPAPSGHFQKRRAPRTVQGNSASAIFLLSLMPDGSSRRLCSKVWQLRWSRACALSSDRARRTERRRPGSSPPRRAQTPVKISAKPTTW